MRAILILPMVLIVTLAAGSVASELPEPGPPFPEEVVFHALDSDATFTMSEFRGRPVLLTFWASWCAPCRVELPELARLYSELAGRGFVLITVNVDQNPAMGQRFLANLGISVPVYRLHPLDTQRLGIDALPANVLLDTDGRFVQAFKGYAPETVDEIRRLVLGLMAQDNGA